MEVFSEGTDSRGLSLNALPLQRTAAMPSYSWCFKHNLAWCSLSADHDDLQAEVAVSCHAGLFRSAAAVRTVGTVVFGIMVSDSTSVMGSCA